MLPLNLAPGVFAGTAEDYARYRPPYPEALIERLISEAPGRGRLLDIACGPGRVALACAHAFKEVWAVDSEPDMLAEGRRLADERGIANVTWLCSRAEDLDLPPSSLDLATIGEAFHRLDQQSVLESAFRWLRPGGVLATMGANVLHGADGWQRLALDIIEEWVRPAFPTGWAIAAPGALSTSPALLDQFQRFGFRDVADHEYQMAHLWTVDGILGYLRSMSLCSPLVMGDRRPDFEAAMRSALLALNPAGEFEGALEFGLTIARRPR